jgi:peroxiredoxin Q/BCP
MAKKMKRKTKKVAKRKVARRVVKAKARRPKAKVKRVKRRVVKAAAPRSVATPVGEVSVPSVELRVGDPAPDFSVEDDSGRQVSLSDFRGRKVVLYFYPKDDTPGCTIEACAFRDGLSEIEATGAVVLGVSVDSVDSHQNFKQKYNLNFPLLSDIAKEIVQKYGVWKLKSMYGRTYMGIERTTFLIDEEGRVARIFPKVDVNVHYQEVLGALQPAAA